ncbi:MAG: DUF3788 domain-containing protein [Rickettsiales bacterium]|jgi:hypothetical protein|nr:DUF3788 domain-containing protein [Rickettsiales bacterium]
MIDKMNSKIKPSKNDLIKVVKNYKYLQKFCDFVELEFAATHQIDYSTCSMAPGWNLKYKKGSKSICTIYPNKDECGVMITLNAASLEKFYTMDKLFSKSLRDLEKSMKGLNGAKWLTVNIIDDDGLEEAKKLIMLKFGK